MINLILIFISCFVVGNFANGQNIASINDILDTLNSKEYRVDLQNETIDYTFYPLGVLELESTDDYSVYYILDGNVTDLEVSTGLQAGFKLILYSHSLSRGLLLSFTRSHSVQHKQNDYYVLDFHTNEGLIIPEKEVVNQLLETIESVRINYIDDIPSDTFSAFTFLGTEEVRFSVSGSYCDMKLESLLKVIESFKDSVPSGKK